MTGTQVVLMGSRRVHREGAQVLGRTDPQDWCELTLKLRRKAPLPEPAAQGSATLTHATLGEQHGASADDIETVERVLTPLGIQIRSKNPASRSVRAAGPASAMETAFGVHLLRVVHDARQYRGRVGDIHLPAELDGIVVGVFGLDSRPMVRHATASRRTTQAEAFRRPARDPGFSRRSSRPRTTFLRVMARGRP